MACKFRIIYSKWYNTLMSHPWLMSGCSLNDETGSGVDQQRNLAKAFRLIKRICTFYQKFFAPELLNGLHSLELIL